MSSKVQKAFNIATSAHFEETRKMGMPFVLHPIETAIILHHYAFNEDIVSAGLLHDTLEHKVCTRSELKQFDKNVYKIVDQLTEKPNSDWYIKKQGYIDGILTEEAKIVALADKISNLKETYRYKNDDVWSIFKTGKEGQKWFFEKLKVKLKIDYNIYNEFIYWIDKLFINI